MDTDFWKRVRQARRVADLTQAKLADVCGVTRSAVAQWESPNASVHVDPTPDRIALIAKHTGVSVDWLMTGKESEAPRPFRTGAQPPPFEDDEPTRSWTYVSKPGPIDVVGKASGLPDMVIGQKVFAFAQTPEQYAAKVREMAQKYPGAKAYVMLITDEATVVPVSSAADALANVARLISED